MSAPFDVVILGSGFAGSLLGLLLRKRGRSVLIIDRQRHPRFAIGESSTPAADFILESLCEQYDLPQLRPLCRYGTWCREQPTISRGLKRGFSYFHHGTNEPFHPGSTHERELLVAASANADVGDTHWYREDVDAFLARQFVEAGGVLWEGITAKAMTPGPIWQLKCDHAGSVQTVSGRFLVDGTGGDSGLVQALGLTSQVETLATRSRSLFGHFTGVREWGDLLDEAGHSRVDHPYPCDQAALHHIVDGGWMWVLRFDNGITSVGWSLDARRSPFPSHITPVDEWTQLLHRYPSVAQQMEQAVPALPFTAVHPLIRTGRLQRLVTPAAGVNWALLPHTAGFIDPLYSTGIAHSLLGVETLAGILCDDSNDSGQAESLDAYSHQVEQEITLIDQLVALSFRTLGRDPRLLHAASMVYFAAATTFENTRRLGHRRAFLLADNVEFRRSVNELCRTFPKKDAAEQVITDWVAGVECHLVPWNSVGLFHPVHPQMYWYTATK